MSPEPAPYGADLSRPVTPGPWEALDVDDEDVPVVVEHPPAFEGVVTIAMTKAWNAHAIAAVPDYVDALDAANAEVLRLRAERDALREVVEAVREECANTYRYYPEWLVEPDAKFGARIYAQGRVATANLILENILPAPTEPSNLYPPARGAVAPTTTPQAPGGSGANTGEAGRG